MIRLIALELPVHWRWAVRIQSRFDTLELQYLATALAVVLFLFVFAVLYGADQLLEDRTSDDMIRFTQGLLLTVTSVLLTGFLVAVWRLTLEVEQALAFLVVQPEVYIQALVSFIAIVVGYTVSRFSKRSIKYGAARNVVSPHQREVAHHVGQILIFIPVISFIVVLWGIPVRSLFLGAGALGIVVGFAARKTLSGALSGFVILLARPFEVGDWIAVDDREGIVTDVTLYNTQIRTFNEEHVLVPNDEVTGNQIINYSKTDRLRITTDVGIDYDADIEKAAAVATEAMEDCTTVSEQPQPDVIRRSFGDSEVVLRLRYWIDRPTIQQKLTARNEVIDTVKERFEGEDIKIPFPQRELMGREETAGLQVATAELGELESDHRNFRDGYEPRETRQGSRPSSEDPVSEPVEEDYGTDPEAEDGEEAETDGRAEMDGKSETRTESETTEKPGADGDDG